MFNHNSAHAVDCRNLKIIFARGSSENPDSLYLGNPFSNDFRIKESVAGSFFQKFKFLLDRDYPSVTYDAVSVHDFPNLYSPNGYPAVGIFGPKTINNIFQSELYWWPTGEYRDSVKSGIDEVSGYIKDQISTCPSQLLVLGGYSQGAHVIGESLFKLSDIEQQNIDAVALFGDPKYIGSNSTNHTAIDYLKDNSIKPSAKLWKRGTASLIDRGILDARVPYLPLNLENRTLSWCFNDDFICTGGSGVLQSARPLTLQQKSTLNKDDLGAGHKRYATYGAPEAAQEIMQRLSPKLSTLEAGYGGKDVNKSINNNIPVSPSNKPVDVMIMVNTSAGVNDVLGQLRNNTVTLLPPFYAFYDNMYFGVGEYSELGDLSNRQPRALIRQQPTFILDDFIYALNRKLSYGGLSGGGLDLADPHQLGIEKAIRATNWRENAEKHVIVITERPLLSGITFNMCDSVSITGFGIENSGTCFAESNSLNRSSKYHSEWCKETYEILTSELCSYSGMVNWKYLISRSEPSLLELMQASDVAVSFVVPHGYKSGTDLPSARTKLQSLASAGGGKYLEYDAFSSVNYSDMIWKIINHQPNKITLKNIQDFDSKNSAESQSGDNKQLQLFTQAKQLFSVSGDIYFNNYSWDIDGDGIIDEITSSPQLEHVYNSAIQNKYITVTGSSEDSTSTLKLPINVVDVGQMGPETLPELKSIMASEMGDGSIYVEWQCSEGAVIFIDIDGDDAPDISAPCEQLSTLIGGDAIKSLNIWVENYVGKSQKVIVEVKEYISDKITDDQPDDNLENESEDSDATSQDTLNNELVYNEQLQIKAEKIINMLQQSQSESTGNNVDTYNPQKTQNTSQKALPADQKATTFTQSSMVQEFDTAQAPKYISTIDAAMHVIILVVLPLVVIYVKIKLNTKK